MTLQVDFEHFVEATKRHLKSPMIYVARRENRTYATAADTEAKLIVAASTSLGIEEVKSRLTQAGMEANLGGWLEGMGSAGEALGEPPFVVSVAYRTGDDMPGVWVDAYSSQPTPAMVLKALYDEFQETGEVGDVAFEEFVRMASPNVVIVSPTEIERFLSEKEPGC